MPLHGYTPMFETMLAHPNIKLMLNTDYREVVDLLPWKHMIYTGPIDAFFRCKYGKLPYRSAGMDTRLVDPCVGRSLGQRAARPRYSVLDSERGLVMPPLADALERYVAERAWQGASAMACASRAQQLPWSGCGCSCGFRSIDSGQLLALSALFL